MLKVRLSRLIVLFLIIWVIGCVGKNSNLSKKPVTGYRELNLEENKSPKEEDNAKNEEQRTPISQVSRLQFENCRQAAEQGDVRAQFELACMYLNGSGVIKNELEAAKWFRKAAERGEPSSQFNLGLMYLKGIGVLRDHANAAKWFRKAAEQGHVRAQYNLGVRYSKGEGVSKNYSESFKWFQKAAEQGHPYAQYVVGGMYSKGYGVPQDNAQAAKWYSKAAMQGNVSAQRNLGFMYLKGDKIPKNYAKAEKWLSKAAEQGDELASRYLDAVILMGSEFPEWDYLGYSDNFHTLAHPNDIRRDGNLIYFWVIWVPVKETQSNIKSTKMCWVGDCAKSKWALVCQYEFGPNNKLLDTYSPKAPEERMEPVIPGTVSQTTLRYACSKVQKEALEREKPKEAGVSFGTGWPVAGGYVVTNNHVVSDHKNISLILTDGTRISAQVAVSDKSNDLALLKPENAKHLPPAIPLSSSPVKIGAAVLTMGYPHPDILGSKPKLTEGVVSAESGLGDDPRVLQISVPVQAGNSGGPLINMEGEVVGVVMAKLNAVKMLKWTGDFPQNVNYAIKVPYVTGLLSSARVKHSIKTLNMKQVKSIEDIAAQITDSILLVVAE
ncbi:MAG: trypsin-like peptidase domain-containing protein [Deltaproteobacteria bacterium]|nr:trypsin-like peptidase domain-containing protein [Deltaproteobacteria bacterium]